MSINTYFINKETLNGTISQTIYKFPDLNVVVYKGVNCSLNFNTDAVRDNRSTFLNSSFINNRDINYGTGEAIYYFHELFARPRSSVRASLELKDDYKVIARSRVKVDCKPQVLRFSNVKSIASVSRVRVAHNKVMNLVMHTGAVVSSSTIGNVIRNIRHVNLRAVSRIKPAAIVLFYGGVRLNECPNRPIVFPELKPCKEYNIL